MKKPEDYDVLTTCGVKAKESQQEKIIDFISKFNDYKKLQPVFVGVNSISAKVVKNRKIAGYYSMKDDLINAGAIYRWQ